MCSSQTLQKKDPKSLYEALLKIKEGNVLQYLSSFPLTAQRSYGVIANKQRS